MSNTDKNHQSNLDAALLALTLDRIAEHPLHLQLSESLRALVLTGHYGGQRLPASRVFAGELGVSRMTVISAYDQLIAEGYLIARRGDGTYIAKHLPHLVAPVSRPAPSTQMTRPFLPFHPGIPDQTAFPHRPWARHLERAWRAPEARLLAQADPFGWLVLRAAIAAHLAAWRGLDCVPEQVVITAGAWDGFDILSGAGLLRGQRLAMEDPGWPTLYRLIEHAGLRPVPLRIDTNGFVSTRIPERVANAVVTPSRHYPTGIAMPLARRLELLHWAKTQDGLIIEDDYDSEFRYQGQPLPSLAGLDGLRRVVYMGSFSKLLSPSLRIGYLVLPEAHLNPVRAYLSAIGARASLLPQPALASFMESGEFATHLRRMRRIYARRQAWLLQELTPVSDLLDLRPDATGMHLCLSLHPKLRAATTDQELAAQGATHGLSLRALSTQAKLPDPPQGLLLGYAGFTEEQLAQAASALVRLLRYSARHPGE
ncbi:PLP-dependent aminotransferase family protein [Paracoccus alkanivorans]|uniref:PLP-dependent aminotransferase family protein n=1 Tax=Paracoccus alkanivorans TaxID=2116655 RepID=A0A3M0MKZ1_9RHOB|nr:PLP-dependent aminotransferase family protein [Paracoccus alkanivorans]RMC38095.1 PLP-dependent aminotransferase family protein [Paracoccus alkanivorans]